MNLRREQLKNKIQFILNDFTNKGQKTFKNKAYYFAKRDKVIELILKEIEKETGEIK